MIIIGGSKLVRKREEYLYNGNGKDEKVFTRKIQEHYSLRCITQILGPVIDTINNTEKVLLNEIRRIRKFIQSNDTWLKQTDI